MQFDFDQIIDRQGTDGQKLTALTARFGRDDLIPLWVADMDFAAPPAVTAALQQRVAHPIYGYTQCPDALPEAMQAWFARRHQWSFNTEDLLLCPGVVPSIHATIMALTQPGDPVIIQPPVYFPFYTAVTQTGRTLVLNPLLETEQGYQMNFAELEQQAAAGARLLVLCSPHNPVGRVWRREELETLLDIAARYQLTIISDEIHADIVFAGHQHLPLASLTETVPVITTVSASKTFNIAGLGLSALVVTSSTVRQQIRQVFNSWHVSAENPFSLIATLAAYQTGEAWLDALLSYLAANRDWVQAFFRQHIPEIVIGQTEGTYLLWLDCRALGLSDAALRQFFVDDCKIAMNPGMLFGEAGSGFMRMNIASPRTVLMQACRQIQAALHR